MLSINKEPHWMCATYGDYFSFFGMDCWVLHKRVIASESFSVVFGQIEKIALGMVEEHERK